MNEACHVGKGDIGNKGAPCLQGVSFSNPLISQSKNGSYEIESRTIVQFLGMTEDVSRFQVIILTNNTILEVLLVLGGN